jgi:hypothetical protein
LEFKGTRKSFLCDEETNIKFKKIVNNLLEKISIALKIIVNLLEKINIALISDMQSPGMPSLSQIIISRGVML